MKPVLAGSELYWGNLAAHKFELQALVAPRRTKIFFIVWGVVGISCPEV